MLASQEIIGYFVIPEIKDIDQRDFEFVTTSDVSQDVFLGLNSWYRTVATDVVRAHRLAAAGIDPSDHRMMLTRVKFTTSNIAVDTPNNFFSNATLRRYSYAALPVLLFLFLLGTTGRLVGNIAEEKSSKLADSLLASLDPTHLLDGKLWGAALISLSVLVPWAMFVPILVLSGGLLSVQFDTTFLELFLRVDVVVNFLLSFLLLYAFYGYLFIGFTSMFSRVTDAVNVLLLVTLVMSFVFVTPTIIFVAIFPIPAVQNVLSFIPFTMPFMMVARSGMLPDWSIYTVIVMLMVLSVFGSRALARVLFVRGISDETRISWRRRRTSSLKTTV